MVSLSPELKQAIASGLPISFNADGSWQTESPLCHLIRILTFRESARLSGILKAFCKALDSLEYYNNADSYLYIDTAQAIRTQLDSLPDAYGLDQRIYALRARLGIGEKPQKSSYDYSFLNDACQWKLSLAYSPNGAISEKQKEAIDAVLQYPQFIQLLKKNQPLKEAFYSWTIQDHNDPYIFMLYPDITKKIVEGCIAGRVGLDNLLSRDDKSLYLKCEGQFLDLRDPEAKAVVSCGRSITFNDISLCFQNRRKVFGDIDSNSNGFLNWSPRFFARFDPSINSYNPINFNEPEWWKQVPHESILTHKELQFHMQTPDVPDGNKWYYSTVGASESNKDVMMSGNHGYTVIAMPHEDGRYILYSFGKYTYADYPQGIYEKLRVALQIVPGRIISPDGTTKETKRDREYKTVSMTPEDGLATMAEIRLDILQGLRKEMPFQFFHENCMLWSLEKIDDRLTSQQKRTSYVQPFQSEARGMLKVALFIYSFVPSIISRTFLNIFAWYFGGYNEINLKTRDGIPYKANFMTRTPWDPRGFECANPSLFLLRRRRGEMR